MEMLKTMVEAEGPNTSLLEVRLLAVCLVAFAGFLSCDELTKLKCRDVTFNDQGMVINIVSRKTDQYREGSSLAIARTGTPTCPVTILAWQSCHTRQIICLEQLYLLRRASA